MAMISVINDEPESSDTTLAAPVAAVFRALGEPARLSILRHLFTGEHSVRELTDHLGLAQSTVSAHLACLRDCGLVRPRTVGRSSRYSVADPARLAALLAGADELVHGPGADAASCPHLEAR